MKILVIGSSGRIGTEIKKQFEGYELICPHRDVYSEWHKKTKLNEISDFIQLNQVDAVFICSGVMDSNSCEMQLNDVNFHLPGNIIEATRPNSTRIVTFGTIMEIIAPNCNKYVKSKQRLQDFISRELEPERILSLKIHTVFGGGPPNPYMFLGQILDSLVKGVVFKMSAGTQLREYHHVEDVVVALKHLFECEVSGEQYISKGNPVQLKELAEYVFTFFDKQAMLRVGAIAHNSADNFEKVVSENVLLKSIPFRDARSAVAQYLKVYVN